MLGRGVRWVRARSRIPHVMGVETMRHWILRSVCAGLAACSFGCASGESGGGGGGSSAPAGAGGGGPDSGSGGPDAAPSCVLTAEDLAISSNRGVTPAIAWTGDGYAVVWQDLGA